MKILNSFLKFIRDLVKFTIQVFIVIIIVLSFYLAFKGDNIQKEANLVQINLTGAIMDDSKILKEIYDIKNNVNIKGVLLYIDSPGGGLAPSFEISMAIKELNQAKPVIAYAGGSMTSGSYLSGIWAKKIYANKGSFIGSIGVIMQGSNIEELAKKIGISTQTAKAGEYKEAGTMFREWTLKERESIQNLVNQSYNLFITEVANARKLDINSKKQWANARVFLASEAKNLGLIDDISTYFKAKEQVVKTAGVIEPIWKEKSRYEDFLDSLSAKTASLILQNLLPNIR
ncbi:signal peptide peptidase protease IV [Campylobacter blaseri]|uniref:Signal peptide peptidase SppA n=1 Tax=Campylobacter blaseri TaxID=2042961 RepID=A0A2P8QZ96_9BACT|nr:signal peptide peptidase SppA [Campylobacter blaseri]PSM51568.1 signal peptide peptidase SppA [Campylobacter blaseri]PSM53361.1 signal peptide peptidase SppA [Campylobacter blaseri]QKF86656.1 signal peptide peptidase protease IV [Campylobacter blaseri]